jgi:hypothetical protein
VFPQLSCQDPWLGLAASGVVYRTSTTSPPVPSGLPNAGEIIALAAVPDTIPVLGGVQYYAFNVFFTNAKSLGAGSCAGCTTPVSLVLGEIRVDEQTSPGNYISHHLTAPLQNTCLTWQGGSSLCGPTPVRNRTWGLVKSLYR